MKEKFENRKLTGSIRIKLDRDDHPCGKYWEADKGHIVSTIDSIVNDYQRKGYKLTLRQLYYQLVQRNEIVNDDAIYGKLSIILDDCRYSGAIDWSAIEDRGRIPYKPYFEDSLQEALRRTERSFKVDRWKGQPKHLELWTEKDAISNILRDGVYDYTMTLCVNKGFASSTAVYMAYNRFLKALLERREGIILYFGDHDPSGLDMVRDIGARLEFMMASGENKDDLIGLYDASVVAEWIRDYGLIDSAEEAIRKQDNEKLSVITARAIVREKFKIEHIGLTMEQIELYNPPRNPAKLSDPRAKKYVEKFGEVSWEVDALNPETLLEIVKTGIAKHIDKEVYNRVMEKEWEDKKKLKGIIRRINTKEDLSNIRFDSEEAGHWDCPHCGCGNTHYEYIKKTKCNDCGSTVYLSDVVHGERKAKLIEE